MGLELEDGAKCWEGNKRTSPCAMSMPEGVVRVRGKGSRTRPPRPAAISELPAVAVVSTGGVVPERVLQQLQNPAVKLAVGGVWVAPGYAPMPWFGASAGPRAPDRRFRWQKVRRWPVLVFRAVRPQ